MAKRRCVLGYAGTFDPMTNGHVWLIRQALVIADEVVVMVARNVQKVSLLDVGERVACLQEVVRGLGEDAQRVRVEVVSGEFTAVAAKRLGCVALVRGMRSSVDFEYENTIQKVNQDLLGGLPTYFVMPPRKEELLSSSFVKGLMQSRGWYGIARDLVPAGSLDLLARKYVLGWLERVGAGEWLGELGVGGFVREIFEGYSKEGRGYHGVRHLVDGLSELGWYLEGTKKGSGLPKVEQRLLVLAWCAHDIVQSWERDETGGGSKTAEQCSAWWLWERLKVEGLCGSGRISQEGLLLGVLTLIGSTAIGYEVDTDNVWADIVAVIHDVDYAIFGSEWSTYREYYDGVRWENSTVSDERFSSAREDFLRSLRGQVMFKTDEFGSVYEGVAHRNIERELLELERLGARSEGGW